MKKVLLLGLIIGSLFTTSVNAQADRVGFIDHNRVLRESNKGKPIFERLTNLSNVLTDRYKREIGQRENDINQRKADLERRKTTASPAELTVLERDIVAKIQEYQELVYRRERELEARLVTEERDLSKEFNIEISRHVGDVAKANNLYLIVDQWPSVLWHATRNPFNVGARFEENGSLLVQEDKNGPIKVYKDIVDITSAVIQRLDSQ